MSSLDLHAAEGFTLTDLRSPQAVLLTMQAEQITCDVAQR